MSSRGDKLTYAALTTLILVSAIGLQITGSFIPYWIRPLNETTSPLAGKVSYSLWTKRECWDIICRTKMRQVKWIHEECVIIEGKDECKLLTGFKSKPITECLDAFYCNTTWHWEDQLDTLPSLLFMGKALATPVIAAGVISLVLYLVKVWMLLTFPDRGRQNIRIAYLTFCGIAGAVSEIGVIMFCVMLEKGEFALGWGPILLGVGGGLQLCISLGGYLSWNSGRDTNTNDSDGESFLEKYSGTAGHKPTTKSQEAMLV